MHLPQSKWKRAPSPPHTRREFILVVAMGDLLIPCMAVEGVGGKGEGKEWRGGYIVVHVCNKKCQTHGRKICHGRWMMCMMAREAWVGVGRIIIYYLGMLASCG